MLFKRKFFLDLSGGEAEQKPAVVAPVREATPEPQEEPRAAAPSIAVAAGQAASAVDDVAPTVATAVAPVASGLTTAEAIAAELAAAQAERPAPSLSTFAPECVTAGGAVPIRRRKAGANLAGFKAMAQGMMKS